MSSRPRLSVEISPYQALSLKAILPHGKQKKLFNVLLDGVLELYDKGGQHAINELMVGNVSITQLVQQNNPPNEVLSHGTRVRHGICPKTD